MPKPAEALRYEALAHAMQTAVAWEHGQFTAGLLARLAEHEPKHLEVGVNSAMLDHTALLRKLVEKGIIDDGEFEAPTSLREAINTAMVGTSAIARLLIAKGVFTLDEYFTALADTMEVEVQMYERKYPGVYFR